MYKDIIKRVKKSITGRIATDEKDLVNLLERIRWFLPLDGDYLEIGTLFGGSAICVGLLLREINCTGKIIVIDPLNGYYNKSIDPVTLLPVDRETLEKNMEMFDLDFTIWQYPSKVVPDIAIQGDSLSNIGAVYIDADHQGDAPMRDLENAAKLNPEIIFVDNYEDKYPDVVRAVDKFEDLYPYVKLPREKVLQPLVRSVS